MAIKDRVLIGCLEVASMDSRRAIYEKLLPNGWTAQRFCVQPNVVLGNHSHAGDECFLITEGSATVVVRDEDRDDSYDLQAGAVIFFPANAGHAIKSGQEGLGMIAFRELPPDKVEVIPADPPLL